MMAEPAEVSRASSYRETEATTTMATTEIEATLPEDYKMSEGEKNNLVYLVCEYTIEWGMRQVDFLACCMMANDGPQTGVEAVRHLTRVSCEYVWDHLCGKPDNFTPNQLYAHMVGQITNWYQNSTPEERALTD